MQLAVPFEKFLPLLNDKAHRDWLLDEARDGPESMNAREVKAQIQGVMDQGAAEATSVGQTSDAAQRAASADLVEQDVHRQLTAAGRPASEAKQTAALWRAIFHTASERGWTDQQPHELYQQQRVMIERALASPEVGDQLRALTERLKAGDIPIEAQIAKAPEGERAGMQATRDRLLALMAHYRELGGDITSESTDALVERVQRAALGRAGEAMEQTAPSGERIVLADVPYAGGTSKDGSTVYIDRRVPRFHDFQRADGTTVRIDLHRMIAEHEIAEKERMDRGETYSRAHQEATAIEDADIDHQGISHQEYEAVLKPYIDEAKRAATPEGIPADIETKPYHDMGEAKLVEGASAQHPLEQRTPATEGQKLTDAASLRARAEAFARGEMAPVDQEAPTGKYPALAEPALAQGNKKVLRGTYLPKRLAKSGENLIRLFKEADASTALHESAHFLLEMLHDLAGEKDAPEALKSNLSTIREWLGAKDGEAITRSQHEQFARGFERYLFEGKAPSQGLRVAFSRFKDWMTRIYTQITGSDINVPISPEIRQVFDRILASDEAIAQAHVSQAGDELASIWNSPDDAEMNPDQFKAYQANVARGVENAREILTRELLAPIKDEEAEAYQKARADTRLKVADQVNREPVYTAMLVLQKGAWPEGVVVPEGMERIKLDRGDIVRNYGGEEALKALPGPGEGKINRGRQVYANEDGMPVSEAAQLFGFRDGAELYHALVSAEDRTATIERQTDAQMVQDHPEMRAPDPIENGTLSARAQLALVNDSRFQVMEREAEALARKAGRPATPGELLRAIAVEQMGKVKASDIRPALYRQAMERAGRETVRLVTEAKHATDPKAKQALHAEALVQKQRSILQGHLFREATRTKEAAIKGRDYVLTWDDIDKRRKIGKAGGWEWLVKTPAGDSKVFSTRDHDDDQRKTMDAALAHAKATPGAEIIRSGYLEQADQIREGFNLSRMSNAALERRESLLDFIARKEADGDPINIPDFVINDLGKRPWMDLTVTEQKDVVDALKNLERIANAKGKTLTDIRNETFKQTVQANVEALTVNAPKRAEKKAVGKSILDPVVSPIVRLIQSEATVQRYIREMDGFQDNGVMAQTWLYPANDAGNRKLLQQESDIKQMGKLVKEWGKMRPGDPSLSLRFYEPAIGKSISRWQRIMVALNWGTAENRERMMLGQDGQRWSEDQVNGVLSKLDRKDMQYVQGILDLVNSHWNDIKLKQERVVGYAPEKLESVPIIHPTGVYEGGYFPAVYDPRSVPRGTSAFDTEDSALKAMGDRLFATTKRGWTKSRTDAPAGSFLYLDPAVISRHLDAVAHDLAYHEVLLDLNRFLRNDEWRQTMVGRWGPEVFQAFKSRIAGIAQGDQAPSTGIEGMLSWLRQGVNFAHRALNLKSAVLQFAGLPQIIPRVGVKYFAKSLTALVNNPFASEGTFHWIDQQSVMMRNRTKLRDKNIGDQLGGTKLRGPIRQTIEAVGYYLWNKSNQLLDNHTWLASYMKSMDDTKGDHARSIQVADQTVIDIQGSGDVKDLPQVMRGGELGKVFTSNMSWWVANYNLSAEIINRARREGSVQGWLKTGADLFVLYPFQAAAASALMASVFGRDRDKWANLFDDPAAMGETLAKDVAYTGLSSVVLLRDLADAALEGRGYAGPQGLKSMSILATGIQSMRGVVDGQNLTLSRTKALARAAGIIFHLPVDQVMATAQGLANAQQNGQNPLWAALVGPPPKKP